MGQKIFAAGLVAGLFIMGCGSDGTAPGGNSIVNGDSGIMGESKIQTWAELDDAGAVIRVGVTAGASGIDNWTGEDHLVLAFPNAVQSQTFFNHMGFDFQDHGHGPPPYLFPHLDLHFYGVDVASVLEVDCVDDPLPEGLEAGVPAMGVHAVDVRSPELQEDPEIFTRTLIIGYHNAEITFIKPMVTQAHLAERSEWTWDVPRPTVLAGDLQSVLRHRHRHLYAGIFRLLHHRIISEPPSPPAELVPGGDQLRRFLSREFKA